MFLRAIHALVNFIYIAQYPKHTAFSLTAMEQALQEFHDTKQIILTLGARTGKKGPKDHFNIPKLELFHNFTRSIKNVGAIMQYTADVSERLLITHCKHTFRGTNHLEFWEEQCVQILDRLERIQMFDLYTLLRSSGASLINEAINDEENILEAAMEDSHPETSWISRILPGEERQLDGPRLKRNLFTSKGCISIDSSTAFLLNVMPHLKSISLQDAANIYCLPDFIPALVDYIQNQSHTDRRGRQIGNFHTDIGFDFVNIWHTFRIQLRSVHHENIIMPAETVQAYPPSPSAKYGVCDIALADNPAVSLTSIEGSKVVQIRMVFQPIPRANAMLPSHLSCPLVYAQSFTFSGRRDERGLITEEPNIDMYLLHWHFRSTFDGNGNRVRMGDIIPLTDITRPVELIPVFGQAIDKSWDSSNSLELATSFYLNNFSDKETYATLLRELENESI